MQTFVNTDYIDRESALSKRGGKSCGRAKGRERECVVWVVVVIIVSEN